MYVSGTLKDKTVEFYKEHITSYDYEGITTDFGGLSFNGELMFVPWENDKEKKLISHEERHLDLLSKDILKLFSHNGRCGTEYIYYTSEVNKVINRLKSGSRKYSYALMQVLLREIKNSRDVIGTIRDFNKLVDYVEATYENQSQPDIDAILNLYSMGYNYKEDSVYNYKLKKYGINEKKIDDGRVLSLFYLGEFLSPNRLARIGMNINNPLNDKVLPIYFSIKDNRIAEAFIRSCRTNELDTDMIIKNASDLKVKENIISLAKSC